MTSLQPLAATSGARFGAVRPGAGKKQACRRDPADGSEPANTIGRLAGRMLPQRYQLLGHD